MDSFAYTVSSWLLAGILVSLCGAFLFLGRSITRSIAVIQIPFSIHLLLLPWSASFATWQLTASADGKVFELISGLEVATVSLFITVVIVYLLSPVATGKCYPLSGASGVVVNLLALLLVVHSMDGLVLSKPSALRRLLYAGLFDIPSEDSFCLLITTASVVLLLVRLFADKFFSALSAAHLTCGEPNDGDRGKAMVLLLCAASMVAVIPVLGLLMSTVLLIVAPFIAAKYSTSLTRMLIYSSLLGMFVAAASLFLRVYLALPGGLVGTLIMGLLLYVVPEGRGREF